MGRGEELDVEEVWELVVLLSKVGDTLMEGATVGWVVQDEGAEMEVKESVEGLGDAKGTIDEAEVVDGALNEDSALIILVEAVVVMVVVGLLTSGGRDDDKRPDIEFGTMADAVLCCSGRNPPFPPPSPPITVALVSKTPGGYWFALGRRVK